MRQLQIERLAYWLWLQRGMPVGSPDADWFLAEELLRRHNKRFELSIHEMPLFGIRVDKRTR